MGRNNYAAWVSYMIDTTKFGSVTRVMKTHTPYAVPAISPAEYTPQDLPDGIVLTVANTRSLYMKAFDRHQALELELETESPKFYREIWANMSEESRTLVKAQPGYGGVDGWGANERPNELWAAIRLTHYTLENAAEGPAMAAMNLLTKQDHFDKLRQLPGVSIAAFKRDFLEHVESLEAAGLAVDADPTKALKFLRKLDSARHGPMMLYLKNEAILGRDYPQSVDLAYQLASTWSTGVATTGKSDGSSGDGAAVYMLSDDVKPRSAPKAAMTATGKPRSSTGRGPLKAAYTPSPRETPELAAKREKAESARLAYYEARVCHKCGHTGHIARFCTETNAAGSVHFAIGEDDDDDNALTCMTKEDCSDTVFHFSSTEVLLDNAAGQCVFSNADLVHSVRALETHRGVKGVNKTATALTVEAEGMFADLDCTVNIAKDSAANLLSQAMLKDAGCSITYDNTSDEFIVNTKSRVWRFQRKLHSDGRKSRYYVRDMADEIDVADDNIMVNTVEDNIRRITKRDAKKAEEAVVLRTRLGHVSTKGMIDILQGGVNNCPVTPIDVRIAEATFGKSAAALKGKMKKQKGAIAISVVTGVRRETQVQQSLSVDVMFVKKLPFLIGVLSPLGLSIAQHLKDRGTACIASSMHGMIKYVASHQFKIAEIKTDGEGAVGVLIPDLHSMGITVNPAGPGQHVPVVERMIQTVKSTVRVFEHSLPYVMPRLMLLYCVLFAVRSNNFRPNSSSLDKTSPFEQFTGLKLDVKRDLRCGFGDYVQATVPVTDNTMSARTQGCICLLPTGNSTGSVKMWCLGTNAVVTRDQFTILPMTSELCNYITVIATKQGYSRGNDPGMEGVAAPLDFNSHASSDDEDDAVAGAPLPDTMPIETRSQYYEVPRVDIVHDVQDVASEVPQSAVNAGVIRDIIEGNSATGAIGGAGDNGLNVEPPIELRRSARLAGLFNTSPLVLFSADDALRADLCRLILHTSDWHDPAFAFKITVKSALRDRPAEALPVILAELGQMLRKGVWHGVHTKNLSSQQRRAIIRSSMFLKDKYLASGVFEKFKARLVAGGDQQDKGLYEDLSSPTAATASVFAVAAIAAAEGRHVVVTDIGGAFLNASMEPTGVKVHMRLDARMAAMVVQLDPRYAKFIEHNGCMVVELDKALYGCVEASLLWYNDLCAKLVEYGFTANPYDKCVFNKFDETGTQITVVLHVDDLLITSVDRALIDDFHVYLNSVYSETKSSAGPVVNYIGMCLDFSTQGEVRITMENCVQDILRSCGDVTVKPTPAASTLFDVREHAMKATEDQRKHFHTHVAKFIYLAKRVRPECLTAAAFLATRVHACDIDDLAKLKRLHGYLKGTADRGITLRIGEYMTVRAYIDAAYGVHVDCGKSHTGCAIVLGEIGALFAKSTKQKIVTKSSTEAELVGLSDTASQAIHLRNFVLEQGYETGPAIIYQDNLSCMALMKRGYPGSERSRHINIRHFWVKEKVDSGELIIEHLGTELMMANALTKPVQGAQFAAEREGLTGWV